MAENFHVDEQDENEAQTTKMPLPANFITVGEIGHDDVKVYIKQNIYKEMEKLALSNTAKELGSIMLGNYVEDMGKMNVVISEYIEAKYTDASASTLTFTHETWDDVYRQQDLLYPTLKIVGWQHTHPSYGIFLSNYDLFIQDNFFNLPFQIAYVIDPIQQIRGFFQWKNGKVEKLNGFYIYDEVEKPIKIEERRPQNKNAHTAKGTDTRWSMALLCLLVLSLAIFAATTILFNHRLNLQQETQNELLSQLKEQDRKISGQDSTIEELQNALGEDTKAPGSASDLQDIIAKINNQGNTLDSQGKLLTELQALLSTLQNEGKGGLIYFTSYTVKAGESMSKICSDHGINYGANVNIIRALNGIDDLDRIYAGQTILLPVLRKK